jgi:hypothetical protein
MEFIQWNKLKSDLQDISEKTFSNEQLSDVTVNAQEYNIKLEAPMKHLELTESQPPYPRP